MNIIKSDITTLLGVDDTEKALSDLFTSSVSGYIPKDKDLLSEFVHMRPFSSIFSISNDANKSQNKWEIKITLLTKTCTEISGFCSNTEYKDINHTNQTYTLQQQYSDMIKSEMKTRLESYISIWYKERRSGDLMNVGRDSIQNTVMGLFFKRPLLVFSKPTISQHENKYQVSLYIEKIRQAEANEESIELFFCIGDVKYHLIDMNRFKKVRHEYVLTGSFLSLARYCHSHDTIYENLLNSTRGFINKNADNVQFVVPIDTPSKYWNTQKSEEFSDHYSVLTFLFSLGNFMSFSGLRVCLSQFNSTMFSIKRFFQLYNLSKQFLSAITLLGKFDKRFIEMYSLWSFPGGDELDRYDFIRFLNNNRVARNDIRKRGLSIINLVQNPFPFKLKSKRANDNISNQDIELMSSSNDRDIFNIYEMILYILSNKHLSEIKEKSYNTKNFSGYSTVEYWKNIYPESSITDQLKNIQGDIVGHVEPIHQSFDELVFETNRKLIIMMENDDLNQITYKLMSYNFCCIDIPDDMEDNVFIIDKISLLRYKNMIKRYRDIQKQFFDFIQYGTTPTQENPLWRASLHLDLLITFFEFIVSVLLGEKQLPQVNKQIIIHLLWITEKLSIIIDSCIDNVCPINELLDNPITTKCNQDLLFKKIINGKLESDEILRFTTKFSTECSLLENLQLYNIISNCFSELTTLCCSPPNFQ